jgi:hypothetical protein
VSAPLELGRPGGRRWASALLAECLLSIAGERPLVAQLAAQRASWRRLLVMARSAMAEESLAHALLGAGVPLDGPGREPLLDAYRNSSAKNAMLLFDAVEIQRALGAAGIEAVALKGAAMVAAHYPAVGARHIGDLDLLIHRDEVVRAQGVLTGLGMFQPKPDRGPPPPGTKHLSPWATRRGISCELHLRVPGGRDEEVEPLRARSRVILWQGKPLRVPGAADLLGIASAHAFGDHRHDRRFLARLVSDVAVLTAAGACPEEARRHHGAAVDEALRLVEAVRAGRPEVAVPLGLGTWPWETARRGAAFAEAARKGRLASVFFPDRSSIALRYSVDERSPLIPFLYVRRMLRGAYRVLSGR